MKKKKYTGNDASSIHEPGWQVEIFDFVFMYVALLHKHF